MDSWEVMGEQRHTSISITREASGPLNEGVSLVLARGDRVAANSAVDGGVGDIRLSGDDGVGDIVIDSLSVYCNISISIQFITNEKFTRKESGREGGKRTECSSCLTSKT